MDDVEKLLKPGERLLSFFRARLERVGEGILVLTSVRILWVPENGSETSFDASDLGWVARSGPRLRIALPGGSLRFELQSASAAATATGFLLACVERRESGAAKDREKEARPREDEAGD
ncbi:MAG: hypothetical protein L0216_11515 [Planctomycetales bacterium]|nr:hypothetical protein [Planctomycetales bacterium]